MPYCAQSHPFNLILGLEWLRKWNPRINWKSSTLIVRDHEQNCIVCLSGQKSPKQPNYVITSKQLKRDARKGRPVYLVQLYHVGLRGSTEGSASIEYATIEDISSPLGNSIASKPQSSATLQSLLGQYSDVFPENLPNGLPPERSVELSIKLVPDAKLVKRQIHKLSTAELKEVKTQIDDLLEKGFIRPSSSPWGSSIIFLPKKEGGLRMCVDNRALNKAVAK
jgi:hypothetical protein